MLPKKNDPLTVDEMQDAAERFYELFSVVRKTVPDASVEDSLKIMESVAKFAHKERAKKIEKLHDERFGFLKTTDEDDDANS
tara:strand:+ start:2327 stop:2572 length:246 start_codon:yes stop_codon:yes gene_type:complete